MANYIDFDKLLNLVKKKQKESNFNEYVNKIISDRIGVKNTGNISFGEFIKKVHSYLAKIYKAKYDEYVIYYKKLKELKKKSKSNKLYSEIKRRKTKAKENIKFISEQYKTLSSNTKTIEETIASIFYILVNTIVGGNCVSYKYIINGDRKKDGVELKYADGYIKDTPSGNIIKIRIANGKATLDAKSYRDDWYKNFKNWYISNYDEVPKEVKPQLVVYSTGNKYRLINVDVEVKTLLSAFGIPDDGNLISSVKKHFDPLFPDKLNVSSLDKYEDKKKLVIYCASHYKLPKYN